MIEFVNVTKKFGHTLALADVNLTIEENDIFGFVGTVGSGKTTAMKIICGLLPTTGGDCLVNGINVKKKPKLIKSKIGYVPDSIGVYENLKVHEYMNFFASAHGIEGTKKEEKCQEIFEMLGLYDCSEKFVEELSAGKKKRLCIARALIHDPKILLLDNPFSGLGKKTRMELEEIIKQLNSLGTTIIIATNSLQEAASLCGSIAAFEEGRVVLSSCVHDLDKKMQSSNPIIIKLTSAWDKAIEILKKDANVRNIIISEDEEIYVSFEGNKDEEAELLKRIVVGGVGVVSFTRKGRDIESMFQKHME